MRLSCEVVSPLSHSQSPPSTPFLSLGLRVIFCPETIGIIVPFFSSLFSTMYEALKGSGIIVNVTVSATPASVFTTTEISTSSFSTFIVVKRSVDPFSH